MYYVLRCCARVLCGASCAGSGGLVRGFVRGLGCCRYGVGIGLQAMTSNDLAMKSHDSAMKSHDLATKSDEKQ